MKEGALIVAIIIGVLWIDHDFNHMHGFKTTIHMVLGVPMR